MAARGAATRNRCGYRPPDPAREGDLRAPDRGEPLPDGHLSRFAACVGNGFFAPWSLSGSNSTNISRDKLAAATALPVSHCRTRGVEADGSRYLPPGFRAHPVLVGGLHASGRRAGRNPAVGPRCDCRRRLCRAVDRARALQARHRRRCARGERARLWRQYPQWRRCQRRGQCRQELHRPSRRNRARPGRADSVGRVRRLCADRPADR